MPAHIEPRLIDGEDAEIAQYRALSGLAVTGLIIGLLSPIWMIDPRLWVVPGPVFGIVFGSMALWQIKRKAPALIGRKAALVGLVLSLLFGTAAPADWLGYRWAVRREARRFALQWFDFLANNQPHKAYQLTLHPKLRQPLEDKALEDHYRQGSHAKEELDNYRSQELIQALTDLGKRARVRYRQTDSQGHIGSKDVVNQTYEVTDKDQRPGGKRPFSVSLSLERLVLDNGRAEWQIAGAQDGPTPEEP
ncbi:MAG: DUF4190 domain-containing protein [Planctomycetota bacterium]|jgi:hypothetical protein